MLDIIRWFQLQPRTHVGLNTFVDPKYVAGVVAFLCSDDAAMITGQDINVCGGSIMY